MCVTFLVINNCLVFVLCIYVFLHFLFKNHFFNTQSISHRHFSSLETQSGKYISLKIEIQLGSCMIVKIGTQNAYMRLRCCY